MEEELIAFQDGGNFPPKDRETLYNLAKQYSKEGVRILEIGSWIGDSTVSLARVAKENNGMVFAVDHWKGSGSVCIPHRNTMEVFEYNLQRNLVDKFVAIIPMESTEASKMFSNDIFDIIFIDANHQYEFAKKDLECWLPKLKPGGIICGHDCGETWPGVKKALSDFWGNDYQIMPDTTIWKKQIL